MGDAYVIMQKLMQSCIVQFLGIEAGTKGAILYSTFVPCLECTKMAITIGIRKFVCLDEYPETDYDLIKEAGVEIEILNKEKIEKWAGNMISSKK